MKKSISIILIALLIVLASIRLYRAYEAESHQKARENLERQFYEAVISKKQSISKPKHVIGRIRIPAIDLKYVILDKTTNKNMAISITKVTGPSINQNGNLVLAGHNMHNGSLFGKLKRVKIADKVILEDISGVKKNYSIIDKHIVSQYDLSPLTQSEKPDPFLTLMTCDENSSKRLIVVAKED